MISEINDNLTDFLKLADLLLILGHVRATLFQVYEFGGAGPTFIGFKHLVDFLA